MFKTFFNTSLIVFLISTIALAHGEDKPGPHGGHIRMPANFHTEVVVDQNGSYHVYLIDMQFQNPVVKNSSIKAYIQNAKKKMNLKCAVMNADHFHCAGWKPQKSGTLIIKAKRDGVAASMDAKYELPLKQFDNTAAQSPTDKIDHSKHH